MTESNLTKTKAKELIDAAAGRYLETRDKKELEEIQRIVDEMKDIYIMRIDQKDGIPYHITFTPGELAPLDMSDLPEEAVDLNAGLSKNGVI